jgi:hypothetical protein
MRFSCQVLIEGGFETKGSELIGTFECLNVGMRGKRLGEGLR